MKPFLISVLAVAVVFASGCKDLFTVKSLDVGAPAATANGTYDFSFTWKDLGGMHVTQLPGFFSVTNGIVSSSDGTLTGSVDSFWKATFNGLCPTANGGAIYTGSMTALAIPKAGQLHLQRDGHLECLADLQRDLSALTVAGGEPDGHRILVDVGVPSEPVARRSPRSRDGATFLRRAHHPHRERYR